MLEHYQASFPILIQVPVGPTFWLTDFPQAPGSPDAQNLVLPSYLPRRLYIVRTHARREQVTAGQIVTFIDKGRAAYNSGVPPFHQSGSFPVPGYPGGLFDYWHTEALNSLSNGAQEAIETYWPPKLLDRQTDSLWIQNDSQAGVLYSIAISYMVPATDQPDNVPWQPNAPPPPPPGATTVYQIALDANVGGNAGISVRNILTGLSAGGSQIRVRATGLASGAKATRVSVGIRDGNTSNTLAVPVELKWNGASGFNIPANSSAYSDWTPFNFSSNDQLMVTVDLFGPSNVWAYRAVAQDGNYSTPQPSSNSIAMLGTITPQSNRTHAIDQVQAQ